MITGHDSPADEGQQEEADTAREDNTRDKVAGDLDLASKGPKPISIRHRAVWATDPPRSGPLYNVQPMSFIPSYGSLSLSPTVPVSFSARFEKFNMPFA